MTAITPASSELSAGRRRLIIFAMTGSLSMIMIDMTLLAVALPEIGKELAMSETALQWVLNAYVLALAATAALGGRIGDLLGKPQMFVVGTIVFALASLACGLAMSDGFLIAARIIQGLAAALMQPASSAIVMSSAPPEARGKTMALYVGIPLLFLTIGLAIGGLITEYVGWRWNFFINLPVALIAVVLALFARLPSLRRERMKLDPLAVVLLLVSLPAVVSGIQQAPEWGFLDIRTMSLCVGGLVGLTLFIWRQRCTKNPVLHLDLFKDRGFLASGLLLLIVQFSLTGSLIHLSIYAQSELGFDPLKAGLAVLPLMIPVLFLIHLAGRAYDRFGVRLPAILGAAGSSVGLAVMGIGMMMSSYIVIAVGMVVLGASCTFVTMPANTDGMARIGDAQRAEASGLLQTARQVGSTLGIAVFFAVGSLIANPGAALLVGAGVTALGILIAACWASSREVSREVPSGATGR